MVNPKSIFLWEGKVQLGDEPGIYGNAAYSGLAIKFPITLANIMAGSSQADTLKITIHTSAVTVYQGYPGHKIIVYGYAEDPASQYHWIESVIQDTDRIQHKATKTKIEVPIGAFPTNFYISLAIEVDTTVQPGLYDDFLLTGLDYLAANESIYAKFGFQ